MHISKTEISYLEAIELFSLETLMAVQEANEEAVSLLFGELSGTYR